MRVVQEGARPGEEAADAMAQKTSATSAGVVLDVRHMSVEYAGAGASGTVHAVDDVSFSLARGQILGLAGESGSGKSTLANAIARLLRPPARVVGGEVLYYPRPEADTNGDRPPDAPTNALRGLRAAPRPPRSPSPSSEPVDVLRLTADELRAFRWRRLSMVFQSAMNALNPVLDIGTQITDVLHAHCPEMSRKSRQERAAELLRLVGIDPDRARSFPHELSGGMRQRATIAIALALHPEIIIMDEPTTALDVVVQREILAEIADLRDRLGFSVIFITHDLSLLLEVADRVAIMYAGRIVETGTATELHRQPWHPYTYGLLHSFPKVRGPRVALAGIPGSPPDLRALPTGCAFHPRCPFAFDTCRSDTPALRSCASGARGVACHLYDDPASFGAVDLSKPPSETPAETPGESVRAAPTGESPCV